MNHELPGVQAGFRKGRGTRDQIANIRWIIKKAREFQKNIYFCFIDYTKAFHYVDHNELWKILKEVGIPNHLTCLLRNRYAGQEATVRTGRIDAEAETPILWSRDAKNQLIGKDPDVGKDWRWEEKVTTEDEMVGWHH